ncbi:hypothetical protein DSM106972_007510 [Dulcicalothrix desertica PCC 7102]|uniref:Uncharacterized protein n=1 Tax=Dulcicalothrix desertica PCC 7102 TaxID=232991 RepID=A0A3S1CM65_9CYAN|nr:hypothetical protein [Dulcicalothrix desertica]RUT10256.1 hypothetical protein DSM106972_007510 [Dulcicalothrix desertica PCC 7102]TWH40768.1 hypothetical protein CAL7102_10123 [Dulcicalothrix desertica PCC 7102]
MKLSFKDITFIIEAIGNLIKIYQERLNSGNLDDNEAANMGDDYVFLETLRDDLEKTLKQNSDIQLNSAQSSLVSIEDLIIPVLQLPISQRLALVDAITQSIRLELRLNNS